MVMMTMVEFRPVPQRGGQRIALGYLRHGDTFGRRSPVGDLHHHDGDAVQRSGQCAHPQALDGGRPKAWSSRPYLAGLVSRPTIDPTMVDSTTVQARGQSAQGGIKEILIPSGIEPTITDMVTAAHQSCMVMMTIQGITDLMMPWEEAAL